MRIEDKRKVIEVLLCCSFEWSPDVTDGAARELGFGRGIKVRAANEWSAAYADLTAGGERVWHCQASAEAAYRLIGSSPALIREWFGKAGAK